MKRKQARKFVICFLARVIILRIIKQKTGFLGALLWQQNSQVMQRFL